MFVYVFFWGFLFFFMSVMYACVLFHFICLPFVIVCFFVFADCICILILILRRRINIVLSCLVL